MVITSTKAPRLSLPAPPPAKPLPLLPLHLLRAITSLEPDLLNLRHFLLHNLGFPKPDVLGAILNPLHILHLPMQPLVQLRRKSKASLKNPSFLLLLLRIELNSKLSRFLKHNDCNFMDDPSITQHCIA